MSETDTGEDLDLGREEADLFTADGELKWPPAEFDMPLRKPVTHADVTYDRLLLREPTEQEFQQIMDAAKGQKRRLAISLVTSIPTGAIAQMGIGDTVRAEAYLLSFFDIGQAIGVS